MWIKPSYFLEVEDFAEQLRFKFTKATFNLKEQYKEQLKNINIVIPQSPKKVEEKNGLQDILNSSTDIIDDLKECD